MRCAWSPPGRPTSPTRPASAFPSASAWRRPTTRRLPTRRPSPTERRRISPTPATRPWSSAGRRLKARYVRVTAERLWKRTGDYVFALAEMEVDSGGRNVARGAAVTSLDSIEAGRWSNRYLVDGYDSRTALPDLSDPKTPALVQRGSGASREDPTDGKRPQSRRRRPARRRHARRPGPHGRGTRRDGSRPSRAGKKQSHIRRRARPAAADLRPAPRRRGAEARGRDAGGAVLRQGAGRGLQGVEGKRRGRPPGGTGRLDRRRPQPADVAFDRQPRLALPLRPRHRGHAQRLRPQRLAADAPRIARLAGGGVPRRRRLLQEAAPSHRLRAPPTANPRPTTQRPRRSTPTTVTCGA